MTTLRIPRTSQPQTPVGIDYSNQFGARIIDAFYGPANRTVKGKAVTLAGTVGQAAFSGGIGYRNTNSAGFSFASNLTGHDAVTIVFEFAQYSRSGSQVLFEHSVNQNTNAGSFILYTDNATNRLVYGTSGSGLYDAGYIAPPSLGAKTTLAIRLRLSSSLGNADMAIAVNGVLQTTVNTNTTTYAAYFGDYSTYFLARGGTTLHADATVGLYAVLKGFATDSELAELSDNPWQIFQPVQRAIYVGEAAAGGDTYTLTADAASYALTGNAATLAFNRVFPADTGSYALTGDVATLSFNRTLTADQAAYALTGNAATLTYTPISGATYTLAAAAGDYTLTGSDATLAYNRALIADQGAYTLTGDAANLAVNRTLAANAGAYSLTGSDAALVAVRKLVADATAYALSVADATLTYTPISYPTIGRPVSDASNSGWTPSTGSDLYAMVDEVTPSAADYISASSVGAVCQMALNTTAYPGSASQVLKFRASSSTGNSVIVRLKEGATVIRSATQALTATDTEYSITLTSGEIAAITSGNLSVELESA